MPVFHTGVAASERQRKRQASVRYGRLIADGERVYILFDWDDATKQGLIEASRDGQDRLIGRYLNLSAPEVTRPWVGLIVDATRIDGAHSGGASTSAGRRRRSRFREPNR